MAGVSGGQHAWHQLAIAATCHLAIAATGQRLFLVL
jgi:hypothetical protein